MAHGPTRVDLGSSSNVAWCKECPGFRVESTTKSRVRQAALQHAALEHKDKRARWAYDQANHRARMTAAP
jgi:hypothetical protein